MAPTPEIRRLAPPNAAATAGVIRAAMLETGALLAGETDAELDDLVAGFGGRGSAFFVASIDGETVGGAGFVEIEPGVCELRKMYLAPEARGHGLGVALLEGCLREARRLGHRRCVLRTMPGMERAQSVYRRAGFEPIAAPAGSCGSRCSVHMALDL